jgi:hypothetical protein
MSVIIQKVDLYHIICKIAVKKRRETDLIFDFYIVLEELVELIIFLF